MLNAPPQGLEFDHALRSRGLVWGAVAFGLGASAIGLVSLRSSGIQGGILIGIGLLFIVAFGVRPAVWVTPSGIRVRNLVSVYTLSWSQIKAFLIGRHKLLPASLIVDLADGSARYAAAIQVSNVSLRKPDAWERRLVAMLNESLATSRRSTGQT
jgi:hypothetical protein